GAGDAPAVRRHDVVDGGAEHSGQGGRPGADGAGLGGGGGGAAVAEVGAGGVCERREVVKCGVEVARHDDVSGAQGREGADVVAPRIEVLGDGCDGVHGDDGGADSAVGP